MLTYRVNGVLYRVEVHTLGTQWYAIIQPVDARSHAGLTDLRSAIAINKALLDLARTGGGGTGQPAGNRLFIGVVHGGAGERHLGGIDGAAALATTVVMLLLLALGFLARRMMPVYTQ
ncbi:MAG: hypothetical protein NVS4B2_30270 [Chloroflexota bacterium]